MRRFRPSSLKPRPQHLRASALLLLSLPLVAGAVPLPPASSTASSSQVSLSRPAAAPTAAASGEPGDRYLVTPERRALLNTIRYAEGTWLGGSSDGYRVIYGGGRVDTLSRHPRITVSRGYVSAAAGAYQFLPRTWDAAARTLGLADFSPAAQDQAALLLIEKRGALHRFDRQGLCREVLARLAPEWASLPGAGGGSFYGQPVKAAEELLAFYREELGRQRDLARAGSTRVPQA